MDPAILTLLGLAVFGAAMLQAATGIGYGVIAGPIFLVALDGAEAIQISTLHNLLIAVLLVPMLRRAVEPDVLKYLAVGSIAGIAFGLVLQSSLSVVALKLIAAAIVAFVALTLADDMYLKHARVSNARHSAAEVISVGALSGIMGGMLAMPGPLAATWMSLRSYEKNVVRSTILAFFIFAYGANVLSYVAASSLTPQTLKLATILMPALVLGIVVGGMVSRKLSERVFRNLLLAVLASTVAMLLFSIF